MTHLKNPDAELTRRSMLRRSGQVAAGMALAARLPAAPADDTGTRPANKEEERPWMWDIHAHLNGVGGTPEERVDGLLDLAARLGIERVVFFLGFDRSHEPSPEQLTIDNDVVLRAVRHRPDRALGFVYLNPQHVEASLAELDRCVAEGPLLGIKLWVAMRCHHPNLDPIVRRAVELRIPVLQHTYYRTVENLPGESTPADLAKLAARHPDATFIAAHTGNDWEKGIRAIRSAPNVYAELSGSDPTAGMTEMAVRELGAERVLYGSDAGGRSFASQLAKVIGADLSEADKRLILRENARRILRPVLQAKGLLG